MNLTQRLDLTEPGKVWQELDKKRKTHFYIWTKTICTKKVYLCGLRKYDKIFFLSASVTFIYAQHAPYPNAILKSWSSSVFGQPCAGLTLSSFVLLGTEEAGLWWRKGSWWVTVRPLIRNSAYVKEYACNFSFPLFLSKYSYQLLYMDSVLRFNLSLLLSTVYWMYIIIYCYLSLCCSVLSVLSPIWQSTWICT